MYVTIRKQYPKRMNQADVKELITRASGGMAFNIQFHKHYIVSFEINTLYRETDFDSLEDIDNDNWDNRI